MEEKTTKKYRRRKEVEKVVEEPTKVEEVIKEENIVKKVVNTARLNVRKSPEKGDNILIVIARGTKVNVHVDVKAGKGWSFIDADIAPGVNAKGYVMTEFLR